MVAAVVVTALMVPQALGYAALAGVPVEAGLYAIPLALVVYALLGSSPQLIVGPVSTVSVLSGSLLAAWGVGTPDEALAVAGVLALLSGLMLIVGGALRIGWAAEFLSKPIITGFVFGLCVGIVIGEIPVLLGLGRSRGPIWERIRDIVESVDELHVPTAIIGAVSLVVLFLGNRIHRSVPWGLLLVAGGLVLSDVFDIADEGVAVVGAVPGGLPVPGPPDLSLSEYGGLVVGAGAIALVGLAESLSAARLFAVRNGYRVDADREFVATGAANIAASMSGGFGVAGSLSKTATVDSIGARSQLTGLVSAALVVVLLVSFASSLEPLPLAILSATVIRAVWGLMDVAAIRRYRAIRTNDFVAALAAMIGVIVFGTLPGLLGAVALSVLGLVYRSSRLDIDVLGKVTGEKAAWGSLRRHADHRTIDGVLVLRLSAPLFWVNAARASSLVMDQVLAEEEVRAVVLDLEATNQLDTGSADEVATLIGMLRARGVEVYIVRVMHHARTVLRRAGVIDLLGRGHMWRTISQGVKAAQEDLGRLDAAEPPPEPASTRGQRAHDQG